MGALVQEDEPLNKLFSLLDAPPPLNCVMAGYFTRVVTSLLIKRSQVRCSSRHSLNCPVDESTVGWSSGV